MKTASSVFLTVAIGIASFDCANAQQSYASPSVASAASHPMSAGAAMFYNQLAPYGSWSWRERYGWVWSPHDVGYAWRPYTDGNWAYTDLGWTWVSDREWGWALFHYGRWAYESQYGWIWVPDTVWGPAWVAWNYSDPWCGWAPLPPLVAWESGAAWDTVIPPFWWSFVGVEFLTVPHVHEHIVPPARNVTLLRETKNVTKFVTKDRQVINVGIDPVRIERATGHPVPRLQIANVTTLAQKPITPVQQDKVFMVRPELAATPTGRPQLRPSPTPTGAVAPSAEALSRDFLQRQETERRRLAEEQAAEAARIEEIHRRELANPPGGLTFPTLAQRHFEEHRAFNEQISRQNQLFEHRVQQGLGQHRIK
jgi:hypothetical protein